VRKKHISLLFFFLRENRERGASEVASAEEGGRGKKGKRTIQGKKNALLHILFSFAGEGRKGGGGKGGPQA